MSRIPFRKPVFAVHWGHSWLDYVVAERKGGKVSITTAESIRWNSEEYDHSPGEVIASEMKRLGLRRVELLVALGRASVDVIPLQLPPASDDELPILVANQAMGDAGEIAESGVVDYVAIPAAPGEPRSGFAFAVDEGMMDQVAAEAAKASLKPAAIVYRPLASLTLLRRVVTTSQRTMILVTLHDREADISIVRGKGLVYTRTARLSETPNISDTASHLAIEVRRSLAAASLTPNEEEQHLYLFGALAETEQLVQELAEELSLPASLLDPLRAERVEGSTPEGVGRLAPLLGMIYDHYGKSHAVDFLKPKKPPAPPNLWRRIASYAAIVLVLLAAGGYTLREQQQESAEEIAHMETELQKTLSHLSKVQEKQMVVNAVWQWERSSINWLDELYDLARRFPSGRDAIVRRLSLSPGQIDLSVCVRDHKVITQMDNELRDAFHNVRSKGISEQSSYVDYPWQFQTRISLYPRTTEQYRQSLPASGGEEEPGKKSTPAGEGEEKPSGDIAANTMASAEG